MFVLLCKYKRKSLFTSDLNTDGRLNIIQNKQIQLLVQAMIINMLFYELRSEDENFLCHLNLNVNKVRYEECSAYTYCCIWTFIFVLCKSICEADPVRIPYESYDSHAVGRLKSCQVQHGTAQIIQCKWVTKDGLLRRSNPTQSIWTQ